MNRNEAEARELVVRQARVDKLTARTADGNNTQLLGELQLAEQALGEWKLKLFGGKALAR